MKTLLTTLVGLAIAGTVGYFAYTSMSTVKTSDDAMMKEDDAMMESSDAMMKEEDAMMSSEAAMEKDEGIMASSEDAMMKKEDTMMSSEAAMEKSEDSMMKKEVSTAVYAEYKEGVIGNGQTSILFFHAKWCPTCRQADTDLKEMYGSGVASLPMYKVDYDTYADLKTKYGVTYQHTFVVIDGTGTAKTTVLGPSKAQLLALVK